MSSTSISQEKKRISDSRGSSGNIRQFYSLKAMGFYLCVLILLWKKSVVHYGSVWILLWKKSVVHRGSVWMLLWKKSVVRVRYVGNKRRNLWTKGIED